MNYLAHLLLAGNQSDHRLGALLGDHLKGREPLRTLRPTLVEGVLLHRKIDRWSDQHPAVIDFVRRLQPPWRRYGGIMLDVLFDHLLSKRWAEYAEQPLDEFAAEVDALFLTHRNEMPARLQRFTDWATEVSLWTRMHDRTMIEQIFRLMALRHGRPSPLADGLQLFDAHTQSIEGTFARLLPDLSTKAKNWLQKQQSEFN
ncbi:MAG: ACP phosphodiesterase [Pseudomonadota bacterium]